MGNNVCSTCCGDSTSHQLDVGTPEGYASANEKKKLSPEMVQALKNGLNVRLILQDRSRLECRVKLLDNEQSLELSCDKKSRLVALNDSKSLLHTPEQLKRVDYSAGISLNDYCVALHLSLSGNCIPLFFYNQEDKDVFVTAMEGLRAQQTPQQNSS